MAIVFTISLETDLSEFTSTVTDGGDLAQAVGAALAGTAGGMQCVIDDTTSIWGEKTFTAIAGSDYRFRLYFDINSLTMADGDTFFILLSRVSTTNILRLVVNKTGANYTLRLAFSDDNGTFNQQTSAYTISDAPHYFEVHVHYAATGGSLDGEVKLWIDGSLQETISNLDLFSVGKPDNFRIGAPGSALDAGTSGTFYIDEIVLRDDSTEIGAYLLTITPSGIASLEAFGTLLIAPDQAIDPSGIASLEAFGTHVLTIEPLGISPTGIASAEAFGSPTLSFIIYPSAIASLEAFGSPALTIITNILPSGIASAEAFGTVTILIPDYVFWYVINNNGMFDLLNDLFFNVETTIGTGAPPQEVITTPFGLQDGSLIQKIIVQERVFKLIGDIGPEPDGEYRNLLECTLALENQLLRDAVVSFDSAGNEVYTPLKLRYYQDNVPIQIDCYYTTGLERGKPTGFNELVTVEFKAPDPYWYHPTIVSQALPTNSPTVIDNMGTTRAYPIITFTGEGEVISLENQTLGLTITFVNFSVLSGETVTLDLTPGQKDMSSNLRPNMNNLIAQAASLSTWHLKAGNNTLLLTTGGSVILDDEDSEALLDESGLELLSSSTDTVSVTLDYYKRYNSINGVVA